MPLVVCLWLLLIWELVPNKKTDLSAENKSVSLTTSFANRSIPQPVSKYIYKPYVQFPKILIFQGEIQGKGKGQLLLIDTKAAKVDASFLARSGIGGMETAPAYGPLPSNWRLKFKHYTVTTKPLVLNIPGIMGNFYQINPFNFQFAGVTRGDFGIHADRGNNGTLGCIGVNQKDWNELQALMKHLADSGLTKVPLLVANY
jgi:hypothetical protein